MYERRSQNFVSLRKPRVEFNFQEVNEQKMEDVSYFDQAQDDPLFREHLDDQYFNIDYKTIGTPNYTKRLVCEYLVRIINDYEQKIHDYKFNFMKLMADQRVTFSQLFQRIDTAGKAYVTHNDILAFADGMKFSSSFMTAQKLKLIFKNKKTTFDQFVKVILDVEALKKEEFTHQKYLSDS